MQHKMYALVVLGAFIALGMIPIASSYAQTSELQNLKTQLPGGSLAEAVQPGELMLTFICPPGFAGTDLNAFFEECQVIVGVDLAQLANQTQ